MRRNRTGTTLRSSAPAAPGRRVLPLVEELEQRLLLDAEGAIGPGPTPLGPDVRAEVADALEPNDTFAAATDLGEVRGTHLVPNLTIHANGDGSDNPDYFRFETAAMGTSEHYVEAQFAQADGDLDMRLYDAGQTLLLNSLSVTDNERISLSGLAAGVYYVQVYGFLDATAPYDLEVRAPDPDVAGDHLEPNDSFAAAADLGEVRGTETVAGLTIHANGDGTDNPDFFGFDTADAGTSQHYVEIQFAHADGNLDMRLYDAGQNFLAGATSATNNERISLNGRPAGAYYVEVFGFNDATAPYQLVVRAPDPAAPADAMEPNDSLAWATDLGEVQGTLVLPDLTIHANPDGSSNSDFFRFEAAGACTSQHYVQIRFADADGDLDLCLYDTYWNDIDYSTSVTDDEQIALGGLPAGEYFVEVYAYDDSTAGYDLVLELPSVGPVAPDALESQEPVELRRSETITGLTIHDPSEWGGTGTAEDTFTFVTNGAGTSWHSLQIQFTHAEGDLDMCLYDAAWNELACSQGVTNTETISLDGLGAGQYYLEVYGYSGATGHYSLVVQAPIGDDVVAPDNWEVAEPVRLSQNQTLAGLSIHDPAEWAGVGTREDSFTFTTVDTAAAGQRITFSNYTGAWSGLLPILYDGLGNVVAQPGVPNGCLAIDLAGLPADTYDLVVDSVGGETCSYDLTIDAPFGPPQREWTILVYIDGDNNLEAAAIDDLNEMEAVQLPPEVQVAVLVDRAPGYDTTNGNWTDTRVGIVQQDADRYTISTPLTSWGEMNVGSPATLQQFVNWGIVTLPADYYALVLWDHGGATYGSMWDDTNGEDFLSLAELRQALAGAADQIDVLGFDACLMGTAEVMHAVGDYVDYLVASEETEGFDGWDYTDLFRDLTAQLPLTPEQFAAVTAESAEDDASIDTLSATHAADGSLSAAIGDFVDAVALNVTDADWDAMVNARNAAPAFAYDEFRDLGGFMAGIVQRLGTGSPIGAAADEVLDALALTVIHNYSWPGAGGTGLSIYLPGVGQSVDADYPGLTFAADTQWDDYVGSLVRPTHPTWYVPRDWAEDNNQAASAWALGTVSLHGLQYPDLSIHDGDVDWFRFSTVLAGGPTDAVSISFNNAQGNLDLYLYDAALTLLGQSVTSANLEAVSLNGLPAAEYLVRIVGRSAATNPSYLLQIDAPGLAPDWAEGAGGNDQREKACTIRANTYYSGLNLDVGDVDWYTFAVARAPEDEILVVEVNFDRAMGDILVDLYDEAAALLASSVNTAAGAMLDLTGVPGGQYYLRVAPGTLAGATPYGMSADTVAGENADVALVGTPGNDLFTFAAGPTVYTVTLNGEVWQYDAAVVETVSFDGNGGNDLVQLTGTAGSDAVILRPGTARITHDGKDVDLTFTDIDTVEARTGGGSDTVELHGSAGNDRFKAYPDSAYMTGAGYRNEAIGFDGVRAYAGSGPDDRAYLYDSPGNDRFEAYRDRARMTGVGYDSYAQDFDRVYGYATASAADDRAYLYDSPGDDRFEAKPTFARMMGAGSYNRANGFDRVYAYATSGGANDRAYFYGSPGDDRFEARPAFARMTGPGYYNRGNGFDRAYGYANHGGAGNDRAYLYGSAAADDFRGKRTYGKMTGPGYYNRASYFGRVYAYLNAAGADVARVYGNSAADRFKGYGGWAKLFAADFRHYVKLDSPADDTVHLYYQPGTGIDLTAPLAYRLRQRLA